MPRAARNTLHLVSPHTRPRTTTRIQPRRQHRRRMSTAVTRRVNAAVEREMHRFGASRSFVVANALAFAFNIPLEGDEDYRKG